MGELDKYKQNALDALSRERADEQARRQLVEQRVSQLALLVEEFLLAMKMLGNPGTGILRIGPRRYAGWLFGKDWFLTPDGTWYQRWLMGPDAMNIYHDHWQVQQPPSIGLGEAGHQLAKELARHQR